MLVFFGVLLGAALRAGGVDRWAGETLAPLARTLGDPALLVIPLALLVVAVRLVLPVSPSALLLVVVVLPVAPQVGLSAWLAGFVVFTCAITWILPGQNEILRLVRELTAGEMFTDRQAATFGIAMTVVVVVALALSIPYWRAIGVL